MDFKGLWLAAIEIAKLQLQYWKEIVVLIFGVILLMSFIIWVWSRFGWWMDVLKSWWYRRGR